MRMPAGAHGRGSPKTLNHQATAPGLRGPQLSARAPRA